MHWETKELEELALPQGAETKPAVSLKYASKFSFELGCWFNFNLIEWEVDILLYSQRASQTLKCYHMADIHIINDTYQTKISVQVLDHVKIEDWFVVVVREMLTILPVKKSSSLW